MLPDDRETLTILNGLMEVCKDSATCLERAAHTTRSKRLVELLEAAWRRRLCMSDEIRAEADRLGGFCSAEWTLHSCEAIESAGPVGQLICLDIELLEDCWRWEGEASAAYEDALCEALPIELRTLVGRHLADIRQSLTAIRATLDSAETTHAQRHSAR